MDTSLDHNKLIRQAAGEALRPLGLFQVGRSRVWIEDNGWYLTLVEFQSSGFSKGSHLNVALHFLWGEDLSLAAHSFDFPIGGAIRRAPFFSFEKHPADFYGAMTAMARRAAGAVEEYRNFRDLSYAKQAILSIRANGFPALLHKLMICGLTRDPSAGDYYHRLLTVTEVLYEQHPEIDYIARDLDYARGFGKVVHDPGPFQARIVELINERRDHLHAKPSYKGLNPEPFPPPVIPPPPPKPVSKKGPWRLFRGSSKS